MTVQEIQDNYTYKIVRKVLTREFPWIKDVQLDIPGVGKFEYVVFLNIFIDPYELGKEREWDVSRWVDSSVRNHEEYYSSILSLFFVGSTEDMRDATQEINNTIRVTQDSPAIPEDMRLPSDKRLMVGSYHLMDNLTVPIKLEETY